MAQLLNFKEILWLQKKLIFLLNNNQKKKIGVIWLVV